MIGLSIWNAYEGCIRMITHSSSFNLPGLRWLKKAIDGIEAVLMESDLGSKQRTEFLSMKAKSLYEYGFLADITIQNVQLANTRDGD